MDLDQQITSEDVRSALREYLVIASESSNGKYKKIVYEVSTMQYIVEFRKDYGAEPQVAPYEYEKDAIEKYNNLR